MAKKPSLGYGLSRAATIAGWCYLPFYLFLLSYLIQYVAALLGLHPSMLTVNLIYFAVNLAVVLIIFHDFLRQRFFGPGFWNFVQAIILGFVLYYAATWAVRFALDKLVPGYTIYNNETVGELVLADRRAMSFVTIILAPDHRGDARPRAGLRLAAPHVAVAGVHRLLFPVRFHAQLAVFRAVPCGIGAAELCAVYSRRRRAGMGL